MTAASETRSEERATRRYLSSLATSLEHGQGGVETLHALLRHATLSWTEKVRMIEVAHGRGLVSEADLIRPLPAKPNRPDFGPEHGAKAPVALCAIMLEEHGGLLMLLSITAFGFVLYSVGTHPAAAALLAIFLGPLLFGVVYWLAPPLGAVLAAAFTPNGFRQLFGYWRAKAALSRAENGFRKSVGRV